MFTLSRTLTALLSEKTTNVEAIHTALKIIWPSVIRLMHAPKTTPLKTFISTSEIAQAIEDVVNGLPVKKITIASIADSVFKPNEAMMYGPKLPYEKSLAVRFIEVHRPILREHFNKMGKHGEWISFSENLMGHLNDYIGRPLVGINGYWPQDPDIPRSSVLDAFLSMLFYPLAYGAAGEITSIKKFAPLLQLAPTVIPIGMQSGAPGTWTVAITSLPVAITDNL